MFGWVMEGIISPFRAHELRRELPSLAGVDGENTQGLPITSHCARMWTYFKMEIFIVSAVT